MTAKFTRVRGWVLIVLGSLLSVGISVIAAWLGSTIWGAQQPGGRRWTGSHDFTVTVFELFAAVFAFGLVALGGGIFQVRRSRASVLAVVLMLALAVVMIFLGAQIMNATP